MNPLCEIASRCIEPGPVRPTAGQGMHALTVSSVVHIALAALTVTIGVSESAKLSMRSGRSVNQQTLTLSATLSTPQDSLVVLQPRGIETAPQQRTAEAIEAVESIRWPQLPDIELPAPPPLASKGRPDASTEAPPEEVTAEAPMTTASDATAAASEHPPGAKIDRVARPLPTNQPPSYPPRALTENREGRAVLRVVVNSSGLATEVTLLKSSGHQDLDSAAIAAVATWRFAPALQNKTPVEQTIAVPVRFVNRR